ncbi:MULTISPECIES: PHP domain-containing protein [unclassified Oleiphilus]|uniref:PHP domain-containing protein n=1 Tax=unclassified Oleiphilus TaxID=2631174 RepID=UPI0021013142|nr:MULTISPECIES: PHP domain-containing protein [unclassified Oleiphilus]
MRFSNIDLHCHSFMSDGSLSPRDVVERAHANGVECLSLTDHDTIAGLNEANSVAEELGMSLVPGIEISCQWSKFGVHILAYNFSLDCPVMTQVQRHQTELRIARAQEISARLEKKGLPPTFDKAKSLSHEGIPGRPHFAKVLIEIGAVETMNEAFKRYLGSGKAGDVKSIWPDLQTVMSWVKEAGATGVIAHPRKYDFSLTRLRELIVEFSDLGGQGMEVVVSGQKPGEVGMLGDMCRRFGLYGSVGSDFHSPDWSWAELGRIQPLPETVKPVWELWS